MGESKGCAIMAPYGLPGLTFVIGGARGGKSRFALHLAQRSHTDVLFVATGQAGDEEMTERIIRHQAERPPQWRTLEEPWQLAHVLAQTPPAPVVIIDCVTMWVANLLFVAGDIGMSNADDAWQTAAAELDALVAWYHRCCQQAEHPTKELIIISNEVGWGIVPADTTTRTYREWLGWFNQRLAAASEKTYLVVAGLAMELKHQSLAWE